MLTLQCCLNEGLEPPQELAKKLFPSMYASFDFKTLKDSKIPTIEYQGKRSEAAIVSEASGFGGCASLQLERSFDGGKINKSVIIPVPINANPFYRVGAVAHPETRRRLNRSHRPRTIRRQDRG
jgi:hypothetical protein